MRKHWLTSVFLLAALQFSLQFARAQNIFADKVTLGANDESLEAVIHKIEQQSVFRFFYRDEDIKPVKNLTLSPGTRTIEQTLSLLLSNSCLVFTQVDNHILLQHRLPVTNCAVKGIVVTGPNGQPVPDASVFLNNATVGTITANDGSFLLKDVKPGKYDLVISEVGFETVSQSINMDVQTVELQPISIAPLTLQLREVNVNAKADPDRTQNLQLFEKEFIGSSDRARNCSILNPEIIDLDFNYAANVLTASSADFVQIDNDALGYQISYKLTNFFKDYSDKSLYGIQYGGPALFRKKKGSPAMERRWQKCRLDAYHGSQMHFLQSLLNNSFEHEGFRVLRIDIMPNPDRPGDSLINARIKFYNSKKARGRSLRDSLAYWQSKQLLPPTIKVLQPIPLTQDDMVKLTTQKGLFALTANNGELYIMYSKTSRFPSKWRMDDLNENSNNNRTIVTFDTPYVLFDKNGCLTDPDCISFEGAWGKYRVADLLPVDYVPEGRFNEKSIRQSKPAVNKDMPLQTNSPKPESLN